MRRPNAAYLVGIYGGWYLWWLASMVVGNDGLDRRKLLRDEYPRYTERGFFIDSNSPSF